MSFRKRLPKYTELLALVLFLTLLGYLFLTAAPEHVLQAVSMRTAPQKGLSKKAAPAPKKEASLSEKPSASQQPAPAPQDDFDFAKGAFRIEKGRVAPHQTFADLLTGEGVSYVRAVKLARKARPVFNVRQMQANKRYRVYRQGGSAQHLVYQRDPVRYVAFGLGDSLTVREGKRPVTTVERTVTGTIQNSLYEALDRSGADPALAFRLSKVYAWQIDFYRLRPGDRFRVIYEQKRVAGHPIGVGRIVGARFDHRGDPYYGLYFDQEGEYFDEEGDNLRKALLQAPLEFARISSRYQKRRYHPVLKEWRSHKGTDYAAAPGTPVYSVGDGRVTRARHGRYNGKNVKIRHNDTYTTQYLHFSKIAEGIEPGARVEQEQVIGYVGSTGLATGPHVHYMLYKNGRSVDPYDQELPSAPPVPDSLRAEYAQLKQRLLPELRPAGAVAEADQKATLDAPFRSRP